jgi:hypothetical protein
MYSDSDSTSSDRPDLSETRLLVERLQRKVDYLYKHFGLTYPDESLPLYVVEARELVLQNRDDDAIKVVREHTAVGILEARAIVEDMRRRLARSVTSPYKPESNVANPWRDVPNYYSEESSQAPEPATQSL